jgi:hypothetical protein
MKNRDVAYMAGLMDTDGTLGIYYKGVSGYQVSIEFYNDDKPLMEWVVDRFGGTFRAKKDPRRTTIGYRWSPQGRKNCCEFLNDIIPYLVLKKQEAGIVLEFFGIVGENPELRKRLALDCRRLKGTRSIVETEMLESLFKSKPNLAQAYVAGLIDGDGNVDTYENSVSIGFTNMCLSLVDFLINSYGGGKYRCKPTTWRWQLGSVKYQENFLLKVVPYLRIKRERAALSLIFLRDKIQNAGKFGRPFNELMIQPELTGDCESELEGTLVS